MNYFSVEVTFSLYMNIPQFCRVSAPKFHTSALTAILYTWLKPHPPINELAIVTALGWQTLAQTGINASLPEVGTVQGKRTVFSTHSCIGGQQWPTQSQPRCFQSKAQRRPCCLHPSGAPTHLPLSRPFCWSRTYLQKAIVPTQLPQSELAPSTQAK